MASTSVISGTGLVSTLGQDGASTWAAIQRGQFIDYHAPARFETRRGMSRVAWLAAQAAREAISAAGWEGHRLNDPATAIVFATSKGDINDWIAPPTSDKPAAGWTEGSFGLARVCDQMCAELGCRTGARLTLSAACASGLHALIRADMLIRGGMAERVLVVAAEASIHPLFLASFERLGVLPTGDDPGRPFDTRRTGFRMSEAAAAVTLERAEPGNRPGVAITFGAIAGDASSLVAGDRDGRVLRRLLARALQPGPVDIIHAHGTGTALNDELEIAAIESAISETVQKSPPILFSHKGAIGHSLGASGLVSVVLAVEAHRCREILPMVTTSSPMPMDRLTLMPGGAKSASQHSLILANGFGGPHAVVRLDAI